MLNYHLHQKSQEAASLQEKIRLSEEQWLSTEKGLQQSMSALRDELSTLRAELDSVSNDKFTLQTQAAELRAALHSSVDQNKVCIVYTMTHSISIQDSFLNLSVTKKFIGSYQTFEKARGIFLELLVVTV
jgi:septal ring factor EnvC (AmiA/AmiB activator)